MLIVCLRVHLNVYFDCFVPLLLSFLFCIMLVTYQKWQDVTTGTFCFVPTGICFHGTRIFALILLRTHLQVFLKLCGWPKSPLYGVNSASYWKQIAGRNHPHCGVNSATYEQKNIQKPCSVHLQLLLLFTVYTSFSTNILNVYFKKRPNSPRHLTVRYMKQFTTQTSATEETRLS